MNGMELEMVQVPWKVLNEGDDVLALSDELFTLWWFTLFKLEEELEE